MNTPDPRPCHLRGFILLYLQQINAQNVEIFLWKPRELGIFQFETIRNVSVGYLPLHLNISRLWVCVNYNYFAISTRGWTLDATIVFPVAMMDKVKLIARDVSNDISSLAAKVFNLNFHRLQVVSR